MNDKKKIDTDTELKLIEALALISFIKVAFLGRNDDMSLTADQQAGIVNILWDVEVLVQDVINSSSILSGEV